MTNSRYLTHAAGPLSNDQIVPVKRSGSYPTASGPKAPNATGCLPPWTKIRMNPENLSDYDQTFYRNYDAASGRFTGVDPQPESAENLTGYYYSGNNPITASGHPKAGADFCRLKSAFSDNKTYLYSISKDKPNRR